MKTKTLLTALTATAALAGLTLSAATASAASITVSTVGTINGNSRTASEATGNSLTQADFATAVGTAFANNTGGVWDFDSTFAQVDASDTITLSYGASEVNDLVLTLSGGSVDRATVSSEATSGSGALGLVSNSDTRTFTSDTGLLTVAIFNTDRNGATRIPNLTVTYLDTTTASTSGANADEWFFHSLSGTLANPIVSFSLEQSAFVRYDDLGFIAVPEPGSLALLGLGGLCVLRRRRG